MINVLALYADLSGCGDYRVRFPADAVNANPDLGVSVRVAGHLDADATFDGPRLNVRRIDLPPHTKVVSFQRPTRAALVGAMKWLRERRPDVGLVVELDDDLLNLPAGHEAFGVLDPRKNPVENLAWLRQALTLADVVTVSTPELGKRYGGAGRPVYVVRNGVPASMLSQHPSRAMSQGDKENQRTIGWAGYTGTHPGDLEITSGAIGDVMRAAPGGRDIRFRNVGPWEGLTKALDLPEQFHNRVQFTGWLEPALYRLSLDSLDIGIVPLQDTAFNRGKSALKALEMAAAGVPVVASDLPEFRALRAAGLPLWLVKPRRREWVGALSRLCALDDVELRQAANQHRRWVASYGTVDNHAAEWASAWRYAASVAQRRSSGARVVS
jgi:glycosyltransferase involved in cell wall biosynthesis